MISPKLLLLRGKMEIIETVDGDWMVLQNGFQCGGKVDSSGAGNKTFHTWARGVCLCCSLGRTGV